MSALDLNVQNQPMIQQEIVKADLHVKAYLQDIRECEGPISVLNALNLKITDHMKIMKAGIEDLEMMAREQDKESDKKNLMKEVEFHYKQYASNQIALRKANLACQALIEKNDKRELLTKSNPEKDLRRRGRADKESLAKQSSSITDSLHSLNHMVAAQVKQSEESLLVLVNSSATVTDTREEFKAMGSAIHQSKTLLQKYSRREVTDRVLILLAVVFFLTSILYVLQKRLF